MRNRPFRQKEKSFSNQGWKLSLPVKSVFKIQVSFSWSNFALAHFYSGSKTFGSYSVMQKKRKKKNESVEKKKKKKKRASFVCLFFLQNILPIALPKSHGKVILGQFYSLTHLNTHNTKNQIQQWLIRKRLFTTNFNFVFTWPFSLTQDPFPFMQPKSHTRHFTIQPSPAYTLFFFIQ